MPSDGDSDREWDLPSLTAQFEGSKGKDAEAQQATATAQRSWIMSYMQAQSDDDDSAASVRIASSSCIPWRRRYGLQQERRSGKARMVVHSLTLRLIPLNTISGRTRELILVLQHSHVVATVGSISICVHVIIA